MSGVLVVVAAGPGLGRSVALRFAREGYAVGLVARSADALADLVAEVGAAGASAVAVAAADVSDDAALRGALGDLAGTLGPATVVVYNGSAYVEGSVTALPPERLRLALDVGVVGAVVTAQATVPAMRAAGGGTIVLTGSVAADRASTSAAAVGVAKAALRNLARSLHKEVAGDGVRVVTVTIDGVLSGPTALDVEQIADLYWQLHSAPESPPDIVVFPGTAT
ncbi:MAG TPA: SDR family NAD(P)-dependent oxidoreductase [Actinomycetes bacterium]|nr:SDR family NAD(P)-dependent oxidoreductase [Actinomycetes bacterium]